MQIKQSITFFILINNFTSKICTSVWQMDSKLENNRQWDTYFCILSELLSTYGNGLLHNKIGLCHTFAPAEQKLLLTTGCLVCTVLSRQERL